MPAGAANPHAARRLIRLKRADLVSLVFRC